MVSASRDAEEGTQLEWSIMVHLYIELGGPNDLGYDDCHDRHFVAPLFV